MPVVDASVALKWFVDEPDSSSAIALRDAHLHGEARLVAPDLIIAEVANVLLRNARFTSHEIERILATLYDLQLELVAPTLELTHTVIRLATHYRLTFYDALYVGLAQELGMDLITADRRLHHRVSHLPFVCLLQA